MVGKLKLCTALLALVSTTCAGKFQTAVERRARRNTISPRSLTKRDTDPTLLYKEFNISVPIDHFHNDTLYEPHSNGTFPLRYWFDATYYKTGGPVIVLQSGETDATARLVYLQKGILHKLAKATNGIGVVLEHRYYGTSFPVPDLSVENLRFLTTDQALADEAYFAKNVVFEGLENEKLNAPDTAYIGYGGSYAGAFNAFLRKLYPDVFWGTISSSGVVEAIYDYWAYFEPIRVYADEESGTTDCVSITQRVVNMMDNIIFAGDNATIAELKGAFGLPNVTHNDDFTSIADVGIDTWQNLNWDPEVSSPEFTQYCTNVSSTAILYPSTEPLTPTVQDLLTKGGYGSEVANLTTAVLNWIGWLNENVVSDCTVADQDECFGTHNPAEYADHSLANYNSISWPWQYCTQWGFLQTGSGVPADQLPLISRTNDLAYFSLICNFAFGIFSPPNTTAINKYGGFNISYPRLAFIDGEWDPWRPATPHASPFNDTAVNRTSTVDEPFILISDSVHHWDENGLFKNETTATLPPPQIKEVQHQEVEFVKAWMAEWEQQKQGKKMLKRG